MTLTPGLFAVLTLIAAPAVLTNASSVLALNTANRFGRVIDRSRVLGGELSRTDPTEEIHAVRKAQIDGLLAHPDIGVEQVLVCQPRPAPRFHMGDEGLMDRCLQSADAVDVFGLLRQERVGKAFRFSRRDHAPLYPLPRHQVLKAKGRKDHPDRP